MIVHDGTKIQAKPYDPARCLLGKETTIDQWLKNKNLSKESILSVFSKQDNNILDEILKNQFKGITTPYEGKSKSWQISLNDSGVVKRTPSGSITLFHDKQQSNSFHININNFIAIEYDGSKKCKIYDLRQQYHPREYDIDIDVLEAWKIRNALKKLNLMETVSFLKRFKITLEEQRKNGETKSENIDKKRIVRALTVAMQYMKSEKTKSKMRKNYTGSLLCCWNGATEAGNLEQIQNANNKINKE